ncbi:MAG: PorV/PorQ family protein [Elusimicrobia bacterium]|nr:PorV/PorQ family protein [Elusimicrobiota bacterium]
MNRPRAAVLALVLAAAPAAALNIVTGGPGTSGADFLTIGVGARPLAMGGAFSAVDTGADANAVNWNPAALGFVDKPDVTASYNSLFVDENQGYLGYAAPVGKNGGAWAGGFNYLGVSNIERRGTTDTETPVGTFDNQNYAASLSYAKAFGNWASLGGTLKYVRTSLDTLKESAMAADAGVLARAPVAGLTFGFAMRNLGTNIGPDSMPLAFKGGAAYKLLQDKLLLASDIDWLTTERRGYWSFGSEYWISPNLAVRAGYQLGHGADQLQSRLVGFGAGLGVKFNRFTMDYAFIPYGDLGDTHRMTIGLRFE